MNEVVSEVGTDVGTYGIIGALLPVIVSIINRPHFPAWAKQLIMLGVAVVAAVVTYGAKNTWDFTDVPHVLAAVAGVAAATQVAYHGLWKKGAAPALEGSLNTGGSPAPQHAAADTGPVDGDESPVDDEEIVEDDPTADESDEDPVDGDDADAYVEAGDPAAETAEATPEPVAAKPDESQ